MILFLIVLSGFLLRLGMLLSRKSFWGDEWFTIQIVQQPFLDVLIGSLQDVHPVLYNALLHGWIRLWGPSEDAFRLFSMLAGMGTLFLVYAIAKDLFGKKEAVLTSFLVAIAPYWLQSSNEVRSYSLFSFASALTVFLFIRAARQVSFGYRMAWAAAALSLVYVEHYAWFVFLATAVTVLFALPKDENRKNLLWAHAAILPAALPSLAILAYQALFKENMFEADRMDDYRSLAVLFKKVVGLVWHFSSGYYYSMLTPERVLDHVRNSPMFWLSALTTVFSVVLIAAAFWVAARRQKEYWLLGLMLVVFPTVLLTVFYPIRLDARYLSFMAPFFFIFLARGLTAVPGRFVPAAYLAVFVPTALFGSFHSIASKTDVVHREDYKGLIRRVFSSAGPEDAVCGLKRPVEYYLPKLGLEKRGPYFADLDDLSAENLKGFSRIWVLDVVNMHDSVTRRLHERVSKRMEPLGFYPSGQPVRVGGEGALTAYTIFEKRKAS